MVPILLDIALPHWIELTPEGESFFYACDKMQERGQKTINR